MKPRANAKWLLSIVGFVLGGLFTMAGMTTVSTYGPGVLVLGVLLFAGGLFFANRTRQSLTEVDAPGGQPAAPMSGQWWMPANVYERILLWEGTAVLALGGLISIAARGEVVSPSEVSPVHGAGRWV